MAPYTSNLSLANRGQAYLVTNPSRPQIKTLDGPDKMAMAEVVGSKNGRQPNQGNGHNKIPGIGKAYHKILDEIRPLIILRNKKNLAKVFLKSLQEIK